MAIQSFKALSRCVKTCLRSWTSYDRGRALMSARSSADKRNRISLSPLRRKTISPSVSRTSSQTRHAMVLIRAPLIRQNVTDGHRYFGDVRTALPARPSTVPEHALSVLSFPRVSDQGWEGQPCRSLYGGGFAQGVVADGSRWHARQPHVAGSP